MEATSIVKGTKNLEAAKTLVDWSVGEKAMKLYNEGYAVVAIIKMSQPIEFVPGNMLQHMIKNDFQWAALNRGTAAASGEIIVTLVAPHLAPANTLVPLSTPV